jgi:hypothetical protein
MSSWISDGTDITSQIERLFSGAHTRLVPTILPEDATGKIAFRSYTTKDAKPNVGIGTSSSLFSSIYDVCNWLILDSFLWGGLATDLFALMLRKMERLRL